MLKAAMRHAGAVRLDHVLGLKRLFVIPHDVAPRELLSEAFDANAEKHKQTLYGLLIILGGLIGGASLDPDEFAAICKAASTAA